MKQSRNVFPSGTRQAGLVRGLVMTDVLFAVLSTVFGVEMVGLKVVRSVDFVSDRLEESCWLDSDDLRFFVADALVWMMDSGMEVERVRRITSS